MSGPVPADARRAIEAILIAAEEPVPPGLLGELVECGADAADAVCAELAEAYEGAGRGFVLQRVAGGWRFASHGDMAPYVERFVLEGRSARLSAAALETLAIVAYKQPVSRAQVTAIRGVNADGVIRTLVHKGLIAEQGHDPGPGLATLYGTTDLFLERLGLDRLDQLPPLGGFVPDASVVEQLEAGLRADPVIPPPDQP